MNLYQITDLEVVALAALVKAANDVRQQLADQAAGERIGLPDWEDLDRALDGVKQCLGGEFPGEMGMPKRIDADPELLARVRGFVQKQKH